MEDGEESPVPSSIFFASELGTFAVRLLNGH
jgi:hypothetical protein